MSPRWMCQRRVTWAGVRPTSAAIFVITSSSSTAPWAIGDHASVRMPRCLVGGARGLVAEVGVHLDLVDRRHHVGLRGQPREVGRLEVGDADRAGPTVRLVLDERPPGGDEVTVVLRRQRPVDQEQVDVVEAEVGERLVEGRACLLGLVEAVVELAGDEQLLARDPGVTDRLADALLVAVHLRGVDVPVAGLERLRGDPGGVLRRDLEDAEAELRDRVAVVQGQVRNNSHTGAYTERAATIPRPTFHGGFAGRADAGSGVVTFPTCRTPYPLPMISSVAGSPTRRRLRPSGSARCGPSSGRPRTPHGMPPDRTEWTYLPGPRAGLSLTEMTGAQQDLAMSLVSVGCGPTDAPHANGAIELERVRRRLATGSDELDGDRFWFQVFGDPAADDVWAWHVNGHHLAVHVTVTSAGVATTPSFLGAEPARVPTGPTGRVALPRLRGGSRARPAEGAGRRADDGGAGLGDSARRHPHPPRPRRRPAR